METTESRSDLSFISSLVHPSPSATGAANRADSEADVHPYDDNLDDVNQSEIRCLLQKALAQVKQLRHENERLKAQLSVEGPTPA
jgi:hypothetical protein